VSVVRSGFWKTVMRTESPAPSVSCDWPNAAPGSVSAARQTSAVKRRAACIAVQHSGATFTDLFRELIRLDQRSPAIQTLNVNFACSNAYACVIGPIGSTFCGQVTDTT